MQPSPRWKQFERPVLAIAALAVLVVLSPLFGLPVLAQPTPDITPGEARAAALEAYPGATVDEVELEDDEEEYAGLVYEVELTLTGGEEVEVIVDAETGEVLATEREDDEDDDGNEDDDDRENEDRDDGR